jgi:hypothetical protein
LVSMLSSLLVRLAIEVDSLLTIGPTWHGQSTSRQVSRQSFVDTSSDKTRCAVEACGGAQVLVVVIVMSLCTHSIGALRIAQSPRWVASSAGVSLALGFANISISLQQRTKLITTQSQSQPDSDYQYEA